MVGCGGCGDPAAIGFPDPNERIPGKPVPVNGAAQRQRQQQQQQRRRRRFFSERLARVSDVLQRPASITLRELALLALLVFAAWRGCAAGDRIYTLLARRDVGQVCRGATAMQCLRFHLWQCFRFVCIWAAEVATWLVPGAVAVFFAEEVWAQVQARLR